MKPYSRILLALGLVLTPAAFAQKWEFGGGAGGGFYTSKNITSPAGSAAAKFATNVAATAWLGSNGGTFFGGDLRYDYQRGAAQLNSGGTNASFAAQSHSFHYDFLVHLVTPDAPVRPFIAAGGGMKLFQGTGTEVAYQPLNKIGLLTKTNDLRPLISVGGGVKFRVSRSLGFRAEVHDYITQFPNKVIAPALNAKAGGWMHDFVMTFGVSWLAD